MVETKLIRFVENYKLIPNMIARNPYIVKILEAVSSVLPRNKLENAIFISIKHIAPAMQTTG